MIDMQNDLIIRKAEDQDIDAILELIIQFYKESLKEYGLKISIATIKNNIKVFIDNHIIIIAEKNTDIIGVIAGIVVPSIFDDSQIIAQEIMWYINKDFREGSSGLRLLKSFEDICRFLGVNKIYSGHTNNLNPDRLNKFLVRQGYTSMETHYIKNIGDKDESI